MENKNDFYYDDFSLEDTPWVKEKQGGVIKRLAKNLPSMFKRFFGNVDAPEGDTNVLRTESILACEDEGLRQGLMQDAHSNRRMSIDLGIAQNSSCCTLLETIPGSKPEHYIIDMQVFCPSKGERVNLDLVEAVIQKWIDSHYIKELIADPRHAEQMLRHFERKVEVIRHTNHGKIATATVHALVQSVNEQRLHYYPGCGYADDPKTGGSWSLKDDLETVIVQVKGTGELKLGARTLGSFHGDLSLSLAMGLAYGEEDMGGGSTAKDILLGSQHGGEKMTTAILIDDPRGCEGPELFGGDHVW